MTIRYRPFDPLEPDEICPKKKLALAFDSAATAFVRARFKREAGGPFFILDRTGNLLSLQRSLRIRAGDSTFQNFQTTNFRWVFFAGGSLYLISCVVFLGCLSLPYNPPHMTPAQIENMKRQQQAFRQQQEDQNKERVARQLLPRDAEADASMLDLSPFYNRLLLGQGIPTNAITQYPNPGTHTWQGIKFDVRGLVVPYWYGQGETNRIHVGQKCSELAFLIGADWPRPINTTNSQFVIHFANGIKETVPIIFGKDVAASHFSNNVSGLYQLPTNSVVWLKRIDPHTPVPTPVYGFYIKQWQNPFPDETVATIDFEPAQNYSGAFLVAITLKPISIENK
jgi:hypothetical protein